MNYKVIVLIGLALGGAFWFFLVQSQAGSVTTPGEQIELRGFQAAPGQHCESAAILNALNYQGVSLNENLINGFGSSMGFLFQTGPGFPFLGMRSARMLETLAEATGLHYRVIPARDRQSAYDGVKAVLKQGIPVVLRVNMRYLPYLWGGKYGAKYTSFGWHFVTLVKLNEPAGMAWVTDTVHGLQPVKIKDLAKARADREGVWKADNFAYYFDLSAQGFKIDYSKAFQSALKAQIDDYRKPDGILAGLQKFPQQMTDIETILKHKYMIQPTFEVFYGYIETFGTGGSGFRNFYRDYLREIGELTANVEIMNTVPLANLAAERWREVALEFQTAGPKIGKLNQEQRREVYRVLSQKCEAAYQAELVLADGLSKLVH